MRDPGVVPYQGIQFPDFPSRDLLRCITIGETIDHPRVLDELSAWLRMDNDGHKGRIDLEVTVIFDESNDEPNRLTGQGAQPMKSPARNMPTMASRPACERTASWTAPLRIIQDAVAGITLGQMVSPRVGHDTLPEKRSHICWILNDVRGMLTGGDVVRSARAQRIPWSSRARRPCEQFVPDVGEMELETLKLPVWTQDNHGHG